MAFFCHKVKIKQKLERKLTSSFFKYILLENNDNLMVINYVCI